MRSSAVKAKLKCYEREMFPFRLLKGVGRFCHCLQQREKDPAQGAEFENDTIKMASLKCQKEADKLYQGKNESR